LRPPQHCHTTEEKIAQILIERLWKEYSATIPNIDAILLHQEPILDHLAIVDLPSAFSGIKQLSEIFKMLGYQQRGSDYLPDKMNDFCWLTHHSNCDTKAKEALPQIVCGDFRLSELSIVSQNIIMKYTAHIKPFDLSKLYDLIQQASKGQQECIAQAADLIFNYIYRRKWPLPTLAEYKQINEENPLLAWVLIFGSKVNHFGLSIHLMENFTSLDEYNHYLMRQQLVEFNIKGGFIKGGKECGIEQSSSLGQHITLEIEGGKATLNDSFIEFVWRHSLKPNPIMWADYYTNFIAQNANQVVESLYRFVQE
jgi:hypothetical protein